MIPQLLVVGNHFQSTDSEWTLEVCITVDFTIPRVGDPRASVLESRDGLLRFVGLVEAEFLENGRGSDDSGWPVVGGAGEVEELTGARRWRRAEGSK